MLLRFISKPTTVYSFLFINCYWKNVWNQKERKSENKPRQIFLCIPLQIAEGGIAAIPFNNSNIRFSKSKALTLIWIKCFLLILINNTHHYTLTEVLKKSTEIIEMKTFLSIWFMFFLHNTSPLPNLTIWFNFSLL